MMQASSKLCLYIIPCMLIRNLFDIEKYRRKDVPRWERSGLKT